MRGTDVTLEQLASADEFIRDRSHGKQFEGDQRIEIAYADFVRMVAWYGALRYRAGKDGIGGTFEKPGEMEVKP